MEAARDVLVEAVNGRDISVLDEHLDPERAKQLLEAIGLVLEHWPRLMLTRADRATTPVAAAWLPDDAEGYRRVGSFEVEVDGGGRLGGIEFIEGVDPSILAEAPTSDQIAEWESMSEITGGEGIWM